MSGGESERLSILCADGVRLGADLWRPEGVAWGTIIVNPATGVLARYYHRFARFLTGAGYFVLTYDYRGIGNSRPARLARSGYRWRDWGTQDFDAVIRHVVAADLPRPLMVVGHSIGGALIGHAAAAPAIDRILTVGAQYAYWRDYAAPARLAMLWRWHVAMPALTAAFGYFPGRRLGWLEDLPAGVAYEWAFRAARLEARLPSEEGARLRAGFAAVRAPILAVSFNDDDYGTRPALTRTLAYYSGAERRLVMLEPADVGETRVGHFLPFHARLVENLWPGFLSWLRDGAVVWRSVAHFPPDDPGGRGTSIGSRRAKARVFR